MQFKVKKTQYFPHTVHYCCSCPAFLKRDDFYKAHRSEKRGMLWLANYLVHCDWPDTSSVWQKCYTPYHIWKHTASPRHGGGNNTTARIKVMHSLCVNIWALCKSSLWLYGNFTDLIYSQTSCNTPKTKKNLKSHYMTPLTWNLDFFFFLLLISRRIWL